MKKVGNRLPAVDEEYCDPTFSEAVIRWQKQCGRHQLPWQNTRDAYRVWLSEIMLQQTQVATVIPYYQRFLKRFPDINALASAASEEVMVYWSGLGYYTRARNLHRCAQCVVTQYGGVFPSNPDVLVELPGIGRSTAAAVAAFSYGVRAAILDGNVKRVFARVFGVDGYPGEKSTEEKLWQRAVALLPDDGIEAYTQGLMDIGATLCVRSRPKCEICPLRIRCEAWKTGRVTELPVRKPKKVLPEKNTTMLAITYADEILLEQRPDSGIWGGLFSLPEIDWLMKSGQAGCQATLAQVASTWGDVAHCEALRPFTHGFTHFKLHIYPYRVQLANRSLSRAEGAVVWCRTDRLLGMPLPAPVKKMLLSLFQTDELLSNQSDQEL